MGSAGGRPSTVLSWDTVVVAGNEAEESKRLEYQKNQIECVRVPENENKNEEFHFSPHFRIKPVNYP